MSSVDELLLQALGDDELIGSYDGNRKQLFLKFCCETLLMRPFQVCDRLVRLGCDIRDYVPEWLVGYYEKG